MLAAERSKESAPGSFAEAFKHTKRELFSIENLLEETVCRRYNNFKHLLLC